MRQYFYAPCRRGRNLKRCRCWKIVAGTYTLKCLTNNEIHTLSQHFYYEFTTRKQGKLWNVARHAHLCKLVGSEDIAYIENSEKVVSSSCDKIRNERVEMVTCIPNGTKKQRNQETACKACMSHRFADELRWCIEDVAYGKSDHEVFISTYILPRPCFYKENK